MRRRSRAEWTRRIWTSWRRRVSIRRRRRAAVRDHPVRLGTDSSDYGVVSFLYVAFFVVSTPYVCLLCYEQSLCRSVTQLLHVNREQGWVDVCIGTLFGRREHLGRLFDGRLVLNRPL